MNEAIMPQSFESRCQRVVQVAKQLYQSNPDWVTFFREVLGVEGAARTVFPDQNDYIAFEKSEHYVEVQQMVANLRQRKIPGGGHNESTRVITVRLPESLHEALKQEAEDHHTSMNKLCISKLLQALIEESEQAAKAAASGQAANRNASPVSPMDRSGSAPASRMGAPQSTQPQPAPVPRGAIGSYSNL